MAKIRSLKKINWDWALLWRLAVIVAITTTTVIFLKSIIGFPVGVVISAIIIAIIEEQLKILNGP